MPSEVCDAFEQLKNELIQTAVTTIGRNIPLVVKTDASDAALAATLNHNGRPIATFSRSLTSGEHRHSTIEKEVSTIVEVIRE